MNELIRLARRARPGKRICAVISGYGSRANHYQATTAAGQVYADVYSPWTQYVNDRILLDVQPGGVEIAAHLRAGTHDLQEVAV